MQGESPQSDGSWEPHPGRAKPGWSISHVCSCIDSQAAVPSGGGGGCRTLYVTTQDSLRVETSGIWTCCDASPAPTLCGEERSFWRHTREHGECGVVGAVCQRLAAEHAQTPDQTSCPRWPDGQAAGVSQEGREGSQLGQNPCQPESRAQSNHGCRCPHVGPGASWEP